jgi:hypothetical protein
MIRVVLIHHPPHMALAHASHTVAIALLRFPISALRVSYIIRLRYRKVLTSHGFRAGLAVKAGGSRKRQSSRKSWVA